MKKYNERPKAKAQKYQNYILKIIINHILIFIFIYNGKYNKKYFFTRPEYYERKILDEIKYRFKGKLIMNVNEFYFVNGLIRMFKPKKILEIGVCSGGMSAAILNSINFSI